MPEGGGHQGRRSLFFQLGKATGVGAGGGAPRVVRELPEREATVAVLVRVVENHVQVGVGYLLSDPNVAAQDDCELVPGDVSVVVEVQHVEHLRVGHFGRVHPAAGRRLGVRVHRHVLRQVPQHQVDRVQVLGRALLLGRQYSLPVCEVRYRGELPGILLLGPVHELGRVVERVVRDRVRRRRELVARLHRAVVARRVLHAPREG
mmetsp:Transcript_22046/g.49896  ORF Transcript_22046/g.49896 Transcript_22046/m.49896 type:complete len:205 (+) Transcript_22046:300-914(+)